MKKHLSFSLLAVSSLCVLGLVCSPAWAERATDAEMRRVCENWISYVTQQRGSWAGEMAPGVVDVEEIASDGTLLAHCFSVAPRGYVVVPVLKDLAPVMACSEAYTLDVASDIGFAQLLREALAYRVRLFEETYGSLDAVRPDTDDVLFGRVHRRQWDRYTADPAEFARRLDGAAMAPLTKVGPLLTTEWDQSGPYNDLCPIGDGRRSVVGCVALATAQVMNYHEHPSTGVGTFSYYWNGDDSCGGSAGGGTLSANLSDAYDWANMPDKCSGCSAEEKAAVSELCFEVGVACRSDYGRCGTSAGPGAPVEALRDRFRYDSGIDWSARYRHSSQAAWFDVIKHEINAGRPMIYSISYDAHGGHSVVCDGWRVVDGARQYHINYGWGGPHTAWFTLDNIYHTDDPMAEFVIKKITPNPPPVALCREVTVEAGANCQADASVDDGSYDPEGDSLTVTQSPPGPYPLGVTPVTLTVDDGRGGRDSCRATVTVEDASPPEIAVTLSRYDLWPPNHRMVKILAAVEVTDACDPDPVWELVSITSNEPEDSTGDGKARPDIDGADPGTPDTEFRLRAERAGRGPGRIYTVIYAAEDASGNQATETLRVCVSHDRSDGPAASAEQIKATDVTVGGRGPDVLSAPASGADGPEAEMTALHSVSPNPVTGLATIRFSVATPERVRLRVYDVHGGLVRTVEDRVFPAGTHCAVWDGTDGRGLQAAAGIYFARFDAGVVSTGEKMMLLR